MVYRTNLSGTERVAATGLTIGLTAVIGALLAMGLNVDTLRKVSQSITAIAVPLPPVPEPPPVPDPAQANAASGKAAPPNIMSKASSIEASKPIIPQPKPPEITAATKAGTANDSQSGAASSIGAGTGAGGQGSGSGSGGAGTGTGSGGTRPKWQSGTIRDRDYPNSSSNAQRGGEVEVRFTIQPSGRVTSCRITKSSGDTILDTTTCDLIEQRFRFHPATNSAGEPISSEYGWRQIWWLERRR